MNTFQYAGGNPFKWTDKRGLQAGPILDEYGPEVVGEAQAAWTQALQYLNQAAIAVQTSPYYQAATDQASAAYKAVGAVCGAIKGALPEGVDLPLDAGDPDYNAGFQLFMNWFKDFMNDINNLPGASPAPFPTGKMSLPTPFPTGKMSFPIAPKP
jgi:hypothetical protein